MMQRVQKESILLGFFMAVLFIISSCETGGSNRESIEEDRQMIEGADEDPATDDSVEYESLDSVEISQMKMLRKEETLYKKMLDSISEAYPGLTYSYVPGEDGQIPTVLGKYKVEVKGTGNGEEREFIAKLLEKKNQNRQQMISYYNRLKKVEVPAEPKDGYIVFYNKLNQFLDFPQEVRQRDIEGLLFVQLAVEKNGNITNIKVTENINFPDNNFSIKVENSAIEAIQRLDMEWNAASKNGKPVRSQVEIPVWLDTDPNKS